MSRWPRHAALLATTPRCIRTPELSTCVPPTSRLVESSHVTSRKAAPHQHTRALLFLVLCFASFFPSVPERMTFYTRHALCRATPNSSRAVGRVGGEGPPPGRGPAPRALSLRRLHQAPAAAAAVKAGGRNQLLVHGTVVVRPRQRLLWAPRRRRRRRREWECGGVGGGVPEGRHLPRRR